MAAQITDLLDVLISFQSLLLAVFLFTHRRPGAPRHLLLAVFSCSLGLHFLNILLLNRGLENVINLGPSFGFLYGPLVFLYASSLLNSEFRFRRRDLLHLLPQPYALYWSVHQLLDSEAAPVRWGNPTLAVMLSLTVYLVLSLGRIAEFRLIVDLNRSSRDRALVSWLSFLAALMGLLVAGALLQYLVSFSNLKLLQDLAILAIHLSALWLVSGLVYKALRNPQLFEAFAGEEVLLADDATEKYRNSTLSQSDGDRYEAKLNEHIKSDRPYLDTSITLKKLALDLDIPMRHLSQVINQRHGMSFFDFMNAFRVAHFQDLAVLPENRETTVLGLMYEAGFQSKSSFNKAFKKSTGITPTQFLKGLRGSGTSGRRG